MDIVFQQDSALPQWVTVACDYLDDIFDGNFCGRGEPIMWPPNLPYFASPTFFLKIFGILQTMVFIPNVP